MCFFGQRMQQQRAREADAAEKGRLGVPSFEGRLGRERGYPYSSCVHFGHFSWLHPFALSDYTRVARTGCEETQGGQ